MKVAANAQPTCVTTPPTPLRSPENNDPYAPPVDLTPGIVNRKTHPLHSDGDIKINRIIDWFMDSEGKPLMLTNMLDVETGGHPDHIHVRRWSHDTLQFLINGKPFLIDMKENRDPRQELWITANGGDDTIIIDDDLGIGVSIDSGDGDDYIQAGAGRTRLFGGKGDDFIRLGSGLGYAAGGDGDDTIIGGTGNNVIYGNNGNDRLYAGFGPSTKQNYLDGGNGNDELLAGSGHSVLHGGNGDDHLTGYDSTTFYTGKGHDHLWLNQRDDRIYAKATDHFARDRGSAFTEVKPSNAGSQGFTLSVPENTSTDEHIQQLEQGLADDFEFLRSSPAGQSLLKKMDELAVVNRGPVTITPAVLAENLYAFGSTELNELTDEQRQNSDESIAGFITKEGTPGAHADRATIDYGPVSILENIERNNTVVPVTALFHEMVHAYNGATGTRLRGHTQESPGENGLVENIELQAIGVPNDGNPFDFDNDPSTPPNTVNPAPFTENALNAEMGKPLRRKYDWPASPQGDGQ